MAPSESKCVNSRRAYSKQELLAKWDCVGEYNPADRVQPPLHSRLAVRADLAFASLMFVLYSAWYLVKALFKLFIPKNKKDISVKLALVTGGANGLGRELCLELARCGAKIAVVDINKKAARNTADDVCRLTGSKKNARSYTADVSKPETVAELYKQIASDWRRPVDILVNNAALLTPVSLLDCDDTVIDRIVDVNLKSHFWMLRAFLPDMISQNEGHVVCISSMAALSPLSRACAYSATKCGVTGLSNALQAELNDQKATNVRVTIAYPYFLATRKELIDNVVLRIPPIMPEDAARQIVLGIRRQQLHVAVPDNFIFFSNFMRLLPDEVQEYFRKNFHGIVKE